MDFKTVIEMNKNNLNIVLKTIFIIGFLLSIIQFINNRSLWLDESVLALNIINKGYLQLLKPLDFMQVAPILFLQIEKLFSELIKNTEYGLRLFPLISYLISLVLFYNITKNIRTNLLIRIFSISLFAFNATMIYYSSEIKQYMSDVFALSIIYYYLTKNYKNERNKFLYLGILGSILIFLSNVAPIILLSVGLFLVFDIYSKKKDQIINLTVLSISWSTVFLTYYMLFLHNHPSRQGMLRFHENAHAFMPTNPGSLEFYHFLYLKGSMILVDLFQLSRYGGIIVGIISLIGITELIKKRKFDIVILTITPPLTHLLVSALKLYPFETRLILYTFPCFIVIFSFGLNYLVNIVTDRFGYNNINFYLAILFPTFLILYLSRIGYPIKNSEIKNSLKFIEQNKSISDKIVVNYFTAYPLRYYNEISFLKLDTNNIFVSSRKSYNDTILYASELDSQSGRIWFLFTRDPRENEKMDFLKKHYKSQKKNLIKEFHTNGSSVFLYNISKQ